MIDTMTASQALYERRKKLVPSALGIFNGSTAVSAHGATIVDADGRELIDFAGGIGVMNAGHCPEPVVRAIQEQAAKFTHTCFNVALYDVYLDLVEKLVDLFPHGNHTKALLFNTGAESVENAIKIARQATGRAGVICFSNAFHGRSMMAMTLTSKVGYKAGCGPYAPEVYRLDYPSYALYDGPMSEDEFSEMHLSAMRNYFQTGVPANQVACIILEVVQGEGGFHVVPRRYLQGLREICDEHGILLICDEVQSGFGRTGAWSAYEQFGITPDLSTWAKSMGGGMPIGCVIGKASVLDSINAGTVGGTYAGNPVCAAAALANIKYMEEIDINAEGRRVGRIVRARFETMKARFPQHISSIRGLGAMLAFELSVGGDLSKPNGDLCKKLCAMCQERGLILISAGTYGNVVRVLSPLVITDELLHRGLDIVEECLAILAN